MGLRKIGRHHGIHHKTIMLWVRGHAKQLPDVELPADVGVVEMDELFTFGGKKKQRLHRNDSRTLLQLYRELVCRTTTP